MQIFKKRAIQKNYNWSNGKKTIRKNQDHILENFDDHGYDGEPEEAFVKEIDDMRTRSDGSKIGVRDTINDWIDGGSLEVYYCDQIAYLKKLGYKNVEKWPEDKIYSTYKHLLWRDGYHLYYEIKNGEKDPTKTGLYFAGEGKPRTRESNKRKVRP